MNVFIYLLRKTSWNHKIKWVDQVINEILKSPLIFSLWWKSSLHDTQEGWISEGIIMESYNRKHLLRP